MFLISALHISHTVVSPCLLKGPRDVIFSLSGSFFAHEVLHHVNGEGEDDGRVLLRRDARQSLEVTELFDA